jgi:hypothetical protein
VIGRSIYRTGAFKWWSKFWLEKPFPALEVLDYTCVLTLLLKARGFICLIRLLCLKDQWMQVKKMLLWTSPCISSQSRGDWKVPIREIWRKFTDKTNLPWPSNFNFCDFFSLDYLEQRISITEIKKCVTVNWTLREKFIVFRLEWTKATYSGA